MKRIHIYILGVLLCLGLSLNAQSSNPDFVLSSELMTTEGNTIEITSTFTKTGNTLVWKQERDTNTDETTFNISSTTGTWDANNSTGDIAYTAIVNGYQIVLSISGNSDTGVLASVEIIIPNEENEVLDISVNQLSYL